MIVIVPYDPSWPEEFVAVATPLRQSLQELALRIDHIGSTAVPRLAAKDRIDVQVTVQGFDRPAALIEALQSLDYTHVPGIISDHRPPLAQGPDTDWQKLYFRAPAEQRPTNLHVRASGRPNQRYALLFRDYLRAHPAAAAAYALIKQNLARLHPDDTDAYYDIKDPVCDVIIEAAEEWARSCDWKMGASDM